MVTTALIQSLVVSLVLTLILELGFALVWGVRKKGLVLVLLMNVLTNPAVVMLHSFGVYFCGLPEIPVVLALETAAVVVEGFCCRGVIRRPWLVAVLVNAFSYTVGVLL